MSKWFDSYADDVVGKDTPEMERAIEQYALNRHATSSSENEETLARMIREGVTPDEIVDDMIKRAPEGGYKGRYKEGGLVAALQS